MPKQTTGRVNQPLLENHRSENSGAKDQNEMHKDKQHPNRLYIIMVDLINLVMSATEIGLVLYLTTEHFLHSEGVIAVIMLAPILLNFVGVTYFFSDARERKEFEKVGTTRFSKDMFQVPVFGPVFTAFKVLLISSGLSRRHCVEYERFEASAVKMRQAQTFFSAAPEAVVQLSVLLISNLESLKVAHILEIGVVVVSIFTIAEANVYALRSNYFRLFRSWEDDDWEVHESFGRKCILFLHSFCSVGTRIAAAACLISGIQYFALKLHMMQNPIMINATASNASHPIMANNQTSMMSMMMMSTSPTEQLAFMIGLTYVSLILYQLILYYVARNMRYSFMKKDAPGACYESINYAWRSTILHTGFQSKNIATQLWFYVENWAMFATWWLSIEYCANQRTKEITQVPMTITFTLLSMFSLFFLFAAVGTKLHRLENPFKVEDKQLPSKS